MTSFEVSKNSKCCIIVNLGRIRQKLAQLLSDKGDIWSGCIEIQ